jgi:AbrB family looped-hinge helix DNA binding protein
MPKHKDKFRGQLLRDGRITIPKAVRKELKLEEGMFFEAKVVNEETVEIRFIRA